MSQGTLTHAHSAQSLWRDGVKDYTLCGSDRRVAAPGTGGRRRRNRTDSTKTGLNAADAAGLLAAHDAAPEGAGRRDPLELAALYFDEDHTLSEAAQRIRDTGSSTSASAGGLPPPAAGLGAVRV